VNFDQAAITVQNEREFSALRQAIEQAFRPERVKEFLQRLERRRIRIRDFGEVVSRGMLVPDVGANTGELYAALSTSDQALIREFYLSSLEAVDVSLRHKFKSLYQYY
jgi:hypothetical protein